MIRRVLALVILFAFANPALAQVPAAPTPRETVTIAEAAPIFLYPDETRVPLRVASKGTALFVLQIQNDWYRVEFLDPQYGRRVGYVQKKYLKIEAPDLRPTDPSVPTPAQVTAPGQTAPPPPPAQVATDRWFSRGWVDVNFGGAISAGLAEAYTDTIVVDEENATFTTSYGKPSTGASFDVNGGYMFHPRVGIGVSFAGTGHIGTADMAIVIPHPIYFDAHATDTGTTGDLKRTEGASHIQVVVAVVASPRFSLRVFGGPSFFRYKAEMVSDIEFTQSYSIFTPANIVEITDYSHEEVEGDGLGGHFGADASYFFSRVVGIGGLVRFSRGTVTIDEPVTGTNRDVRVGGFQFAGGLRLRFGRY